jgi:hypothetical protein
LYAYERQPPIGGTGSVHDPKGDAMLSSTVERLVRRGLVSVLAGSALLAAASTGAGGSAVPLLQMPFACGQTWGAGTYSGHWPDPNSVDLVERADNSNNRSANLSEGEPVLASADGTVAWVGESDGGTRRVYIDHGNGYLTAYLHIEKLPPLEVGDRVAQGEQIARTSNSGTGAVHLHYTQTTDFDDIHDIDTAEPITFNGLPIDTNAANQDEPTPERLTSLNCPGNSFMPFTQSGKNYQLLYKPGTGDVKILELDSDGTGVTTTASGTWSKGWTHFLPFTAADGKQHYFQYKSSNGRVRFARIDTGGSGTTELSDRTWYAGWTHFVPLQLDGDPFFLAYDSLYGHANIDRINAAGSGSNRVYASKWTRGWTQIVPFESGNEQYLLLYKGGTGEVEIDRVTGDADGAQITETWSSTWTRGWTNLVPLGDHGALLGYKAATGEAAFMQMEPNGVLKLADATWTRGWTAFTPFSIDGDEHVLLYKAGTGSAKALRLDGDGNSVTTIWTGSWTKGWT